MKIKAIVITGFLGAGKTTFINNFIKQFPAIQFALVENEFGDVSLDTELIKGIDAGQMFELKNGCICCTISDEYELILLELAQRFPDIDYLIVETTGIADPAEVIRPFLRNEHIKDYFQYNGTICLVDAINFDKQPTKEISLKQIAVADIVLINKTENFDIRGKKKIKETIRGLNPFCEIHFTEFADAADIHPDSIIKQAVFEEFSHPISHHNISAKSLTFDYPLDKGNFLDWLSYTLDIYKQKIYRAKGILFFESDPFRYFLQAVGGNFELIEDSISLGESKSQIVFIGNLEGVDLSFS